VGSNSKLELERGKWIIDVEPSATVATTKLQPGEQDEPKEGERLFHSQMWVKGTPLQFIVGSSSRKNLISTEVIKQLALSIAPQPQPYTSGCPQIYETHPDFTTNYQMLCANGVVDNFHL
jgi:hypothetical protein